MDGTTTRKKLGKRIREMAKIRGIRLGEAKYRVEAPNVLDDSYGCVATALVLLL